MRILGTLLVLALVACPARADDDKIATALNKAGAKVTRDEKKPGKPIIGVKFGEKKFKDEDLKLLKGLKSLQSLELDAAKATDVAWKELKGLTSLRKLKLIGTKVRDDHLKELANLTNLQ